MLVFGLYGEKAERLTLVLGGDDDGDRRGDDNGDFDVVGIQIVVGTLNLLNDDEDDDDVGIDNFCLLLGEVLDLSSSNDERLRRRRLEEEYEL